MRTLSRYFVARYLGLFTLILVATALAIAIVELLLGADEFLDPEAGPGNTLGWVLLRIPSYYLRDLVPISAFFAGFFTFAFAARWLEWTAIQAAGVSPLRMALPLLGASVAIALAMVVVGEAWVTRSIQSHEAARRPADEELLFRGGAFWYHKGPMVFSIEGGDPTTNTLRGVDVYERTSRGRLLAHVRSERVTLRDDGSWQLHDAYVREFDPARPERPASTSVEASRSIRVSDSPTRLIQQTDAAALPLPQLAEYLVAHEADDHPGSRATLSRLRLLLHERLSAPWLAVVFTLLALPIALGVRAGGSLAPAGVLALVTVSAVFLVRNLAHGLAMREILPNPGTVWAIVVGFGTLGAVALWQRTRTARA